MEPASIPEKMGGYDTPFIGPLTTSQLLRLIPAIIIGLSLGIILPSNMSTMFGLNIMGRILFGLGSFIIFAALLLIPKEGQPLLQYLGRILLFRPHEYRKATGDTAVYPATQNLLGIKNTHGRVIEGTGDNYLIISKIQPIDLQLRTTEQKDAVFIRYQNFLNTLDHHTQIIVKPSPYKPSTYLQPYLENLKHIQPGTRVHNNLLNHIDSFKKTIVDFECIKYNFYIINNINIRGIAPKLLQEEKTMLRNTKNLEEKKNIRKQYRAKKYAKANNALVLRMKTTMAALRSVDPDIDVIEPADTEIEDVLRDIYTPVEYPKDTTIGGIVT